MMAGILKQNYHKLTDNEDEADTILVNTCSVKNATQSKEIHYIKEKSKAKKVIAELKKEAKLADEVIARVQEMGKRVVVWAGGKNSV